MRKRFNAVFRPPSPPFWGPSSTQYPAFVPDLTSGQALGARQIRPRGEASCTRTLSHPMPPFPPSLSAASEGAFLPNPACLFLSCGVTDEGFICGAPEGDH